MNDYNDSRKRAVTKVLKNEKNSYYLLYVLKTEFKCFTVIITVKKYINNNNTLYSR